MHKEGGPMNSPNAILKPTGDQLPGKPGSSAARTFFLWVVIGLAFVVITAFYFLRRLNRLELQVAGLGKQAEQTNQSLRQIAEKSDVALHHASQAEANAQQAAQLRDQAETAKAKSEEEAEVAKQQAQVARNDATLAQQKAEEYRKQREEELNRLQTALSQIADTRRTAMGLIMTLLIAVGPERGQVGFSSLRCTQITLPAFFRSPANWYAGPTAAQAQ